jgi:NNP family nitrate/nitrite transporter-like MFS transporter
MMTETRRDVAGTIFFLFLIFFLNMLSRLGLAPFLPGIGQEFNLSHAASGSLFIFVSVGYGSGLIGSTFISARICHQHQIVLSAIAVGASLLVISFTSNLWPLRWTLYVLGFAGGLYLPSSVATLTSLVDRQHWGKVLSFHQLAPNLAYICSPLLAEIFLCQQSWRFTLALYGIAAILAGILFQLLGKTDRAYGERPGMASIGRLLANPAIWIMILLFSLAIGVNQGLFNILALYLTAERQLDSTQANHLMSVSRVIAFAMPLLTGWLADRYGLKKTLFVSVAASAVATFSIATLPGGWLGVSLVMQATASVCFFPLGFTVLSRITTVNNRNMAVALTVPFSYLFGAGMVPTLIGYSGDMGNFNWGIGILGVATLFGLLLLRYVKPDP